jgi:predicted nucleotidyltransferase component of viral defense system
MLVLGTGIVHEVLEIVQHASDINIEMKGEPLANPEFFRGKVKYSGPLSKNNIKIEISREPFIGKVVRESVPHAYDYPKFAVNVYALDNLLAEKMRAIIERGKIRDYYDVWKLLKTCKFDKQVLKELFLQKCKAKTVTFTGIEQMFPAGIVTKLEPYLDTWLTRLSPEPLPELEAIMAELKVFLKDLLS